MKIIAVAKNYGEHIKEFDGITPQEPILFTKPDSAILQQGKPFYLPSFSTNIHYEVEIVVKINRVGKCIEAQFASKYYDEIAVGIDFTARDLQTKAKESGMPWAIAKGFDSSAPISGFVPLSDFDDIQNIPFHLEKNGSVVQKGNTGEMIFSVNEIIAYASQFFTLKIGDLVFTGTPSGVGPIKIGDQLNAYIGNNEMLSVNVK